MGGRLATTSLGGEYYETGGSVIHPENHYMKQFVKELGKELRVDSGIVLVLFVGAKSTCNFSGY